MELYPHSPIRLHGAHRDNFALCLPSTQMLSYLTTGHNRSLPIDCHSNRCFAVILSFGYIQSRQLHATRVTNYTDSQLQPGRHTGQTYRSFVVPNNITPVLLKYFNRPGLYRSELLRTNYNRTSLVRPGSSPAWGTLNNSVCGEGFESLTPLDESQKK